MKDTFKLKSLFNSTKMDLIRKILKKIESKQSVFNHSFYITFITQDSNVQLPDFLKDQYPQYITIVLEHQFRDLSVDKNGFFVTLFFLSQEHRIYVPFNAIISLTDKSFNFHISLDYTPPKTTDKTNQGQNITLDNVIEFPRKP